MQTRQQSICVRHEDVVDNTTTWLVDFQEQFSLATKPGFPIEVLHSVSHTPQAVYGYVYTKWAKHTSESCTTILLPDLQKQIDLPARFTILCHIAGNIEQASSTSAL